MPRLLLVAVIAVVAVSGCRKKSSPEYYEAQTSYSLIVARLGDDAYSDPEMEQIKAQLQAVPANAMEAADAQKLLATIAAESQRAAAEKQAAAAAVAAAAQPTAAPVFRPTGTSPEPTGVPAVGPAADGGAAPASKPRPGMSEADFAKEFGDCASSSGPVDVPGMGEKGTAWAVRADPACQQRLGAGPGTSYVFVKGKLSGTISTTQATTQQTVDAGPRPPPPPPPPPSVPGFPAPGSDKIPPPPAETGLPGTGAPAPSALPADYKPPPAETGLPPAK